MTETIDTSHPENEVNDPAFNLLDEIALINWSVPKEEWKRYQIVGMILCCTPQLQQAVWYYCLDNSNGETLWVAEVAIAPVRLLHAYAKDDHF